MHQAAGHVAGEAADANVGIGGDRVDVANPTSARNRPESLPPKSCASAPGTAARKRTSRRRRPGETRLGSRDRATRHGTTHRSRPVGLLASRRIAQVMIVSSIRHPSPVVGDRDGPARQSARDFVARTLPGSSSRRSWRLAFGAVVAAAAAEPRGTSPSSATCGRSLPSTARVPRGRRAKGGLDLRTRGRDAARRRQRPGAGQERSRRKPAPRSGSSPAKCRRRRSAGCRPTEIARVRELDSVGRSGRASRRRAAAGFPGERRATGVSGRSGRWPTCEPPRLTRRGAHARRSMRSCSRNSRPRGCRSRPRPIARRSCAARISICSACPHRPQRVDAFLADERPDAFERLVDRLLASPHFGERWGRHWLDVAGYVDTVGFDVDATNRHHQRRQVAVSRLRHPRVQRRQALRSLHHRATGRRRAVRLAAGRTHSRPRCAKR